MHSLLVLVLLACGGSEEAPSAPTPAEVPAAEKKSPPDGEPKLLPMTREALDKALLELAPCYEARLEAEPELAGTWVLDMAIRRDGTIQLNSVTSADASDTPLEACIAEKVAGWDLPTVPVPVPVRKSITFSPEGARVEAIKPAEGGAVPAEGGAGEGEAADGEAAEGEE